MNFLKGKIEGGAFHAEGGAALPLPARTQTARTAGRRSMACAPSISSSIPNGVPAKVHVVEPTGSETQVLAEFAGASVLCAFRERVSAKPGETIRITPEPSLVHLFDAGTGQRL